MSKRIRLNTMPTGTIVLDTSPIVLDPDVFYHLQGRIVIPTAVIKELDGLKRGEGETAVAARKAARTLDILGTYEEYGISGDLSTGVKLSTGGIVIVYPLFDETVAGLVSQADNRIVGAALKLKNSGEDVTLLTCDRNMRSVARGYRIKTEAFHGIEVEAVSEDIHKSGQESRASEAVSEGMCLKPIDRREKPVCRRHHVAQVKQKRAVHGETPLRWLSPVFWIKRLLRVLNRLRGEDLFWTMPDDQYRLAMEYRESIEAFGKTKTPEPQ